MSDLTNILREMSGERQAKKQPKVAAVFSQVADEVDYLESELKKANAREKAAFMAGVDATQHGKDFFDEEQAWSEYRCKDDSDWKVTDE